MLVLSLFPGIGMLDRAFEEEGFTVVRGPDVLWGGNIRSFHPPVGVFDGVIGGPPCQMFSALAHLVRAQGYEPRFGNLIPEFERCVEEASPRWFVMENVPGAPLPEADGYQVHAQILNNRWLGEEQQRKRRISFGSRDGRKLHVELSALETCIKYVAVKADPRATRDRPKYQREQNQAVTAAHSGHGTVYKKQVTAVVGSLRETPVAIGGSGKLKASIAASVTSSDGAGKVKQVRYTLADACRLQGLPEDFLADAPFTAEGKLKAVANGVPLPMGRAIARAVKRALGIEDAA